MKKRIPTTTLKLQGSATAKRRKSEADFGTLTRLPDPPEHLDERAAGKWAELGTLLVEAGVLTPADLDTLAGYCVAWSRFVDAELAIQRDGATIVYSTGVQGPNPHQRIWKDAQRRMDIAGAELGLGPKSRIGLVGAPKAPADPLEEFLALARSSS